MDRFPLTTQVSSPPLDGSFQRALEESRANYTEIVKFVGDTTKYVEFVHGKWQGIRSIVNPEASVIVSVTAARPTKSCETDRSLHRRGDGAWRLPAVPRFCRPREIVAFPVVVCIETK